MDFSWCKEFKSLEIKSQKLKNNQINDFIKASLFLNNISYNSSNKIYTFYLNHIESYQILIFEKNFSSIYLECFKTSSLLKDNSFTLFYHKNYFVLYKGFEPFFFQVVNHELDKIQLEQYINSRLEVKINHTEIIDDSDLNLYLKEFEKRKLKPKLVNYNEKRDNFYKIYFLYILVIVCIVSFFIYTSEKEKIEVQPKAKTQQYEKFRPFLKKYLKIVSKLKKYNLQLKHLAYKNNKISLSFSSKNKAKIYKYLLIYKDSILNQSITYLEDKKIFNCEVEFKI